MKPHPKYSLSEQETRDFVDRLRAGVGAYVRDRRWKANVPRYAEVCFHEVAHIVADIEFGFPISTVHVNPDWDSGMVVSPITAPGMSEAYLSIAFAFTSLVGPAATGVLGGAGRVLPESVIPDMMVARFCLEYGTEYEFWFLDALLKNGGSGNDAISNKKAYKQAKDYVLSIYRDCKPIRSREEAEAIFQRLRADANQWAFSKRELLLRGAVELAYRRKQRGGRTKGMQGSVAVAGMERAGASYFFPSPIDVRAYERAASC